MIDSSFYAYDQSTGVPTNDLEFMDIGQGVYPMFLAACEIGEADEKTLIGISPETGPVTQLVRDALDL